MVLLAAVVDQWRAPLVGLSVDNWCHAGGRAELDKVLRWVAQTTHHAARQSAARVCTGHCTARDSSCRRNANSLSCSHQLPVSLSTDCLCRLVVAPQCTPPPPPAPPPPPLRVTELQLL